MSETKSAGGYKVQELMMDRLEELAAAFQGMRAEIKELKGEKHDKNINTREVTREEGDEEEEYETKHVEVGLGDEMGYTDSDFGLSDKADHNVVIRICSFDVIDD
jgi:hypothetical protein